jgi:hypothetical protein
MTSGLEGSSGSLAPVGWRIEFEIHTVHGEIQRGKTETIVATQTYQSLMVS